MTEARAGGGPQLHALPAMVCPGPSPTPMAGATSRPMGATPLHSRSYPWTLGRLAQGFSDMRGPLGRPQEGMTSPTGQAGALATRRPSACSFSVRGTTWAERPQFSSAVRVGLMVALLDAASCSHPTNDQAFVSVWPGPKLSCRCHAHWISVFGPLTLV